MSNTKPKINNNFYDFNPDYEKSVLKRLAIRGTGASVFAQIIVSGIQMVGTIILARLLAPDDFGLVAMVVVISLLLANFGGNGFVEAIIQAQEINHGKINTIFWLNTGISVALTVLFMASSPFIASLYGDQRIVSIALILGLQIIISGLATQHLAILQRKLQIYRVAANNIVAQLLSVSVSISMALYGFGYWSLIGRHVSYSASITLGVWLLCGWRPGLPRQFERVGNLVKFTLNVYGNFCINYLSRNIDKVIIGKFHGPFQLGQYERAYHISNMLHGQLTLPIANVAVATLSRLRNDPESFLRYYIKILSIIAFVSMPLSSIFTLIGQDLILLFLGDQWTIAGHVFTVIGPSIGIMLLYRTNPWLHYSIGRADRSFKWSILGTAVTVILFFIGIPFGALGVAVAYSASFYVLIIPGLLYAGKPIKLKLKHIYSAVWRYYIAALLSGLLCFYIYSAGLSEALLDMNIFIRLISASIFCMLIYLVLVIVLYRGIYPIVQLINLLRDMVPRLQNGR